MTRQLSAFQGCRALLVSGLLVLAVLATACGSPTSNPRAADKPTTTPTSTAHASASAVQALLKEGITEADANQVDQAMTTFKDVLLLSPKNTYALYNLGLIEQMHKNASAAISYYKRALAGDPTYTPAMYNEAILLEQSDLDSALTLYQTIVKINPKASTAWLRMAFVYAEQGKTTQAQQARAKAIELDPTLSKYPLPAKCSRPNC